MTYEELLAESERLRLVVKEKPLKANKGRIRGLHIAIKRDLSSSAEKACVLAEELGHYYTGTGDILDQSIRINRKQENIARAWSYSKLIPLERLVEAYSASVRGRHDLAEYLGVTEGYLEQAIDYYAGKYGPSVVVGDYELSFEPLAVRRVSHYYYVKSERS